MHIPYHFHFNVITAGIQIINSIVNYVGGVGNVAFAVQSNSSDCQEDYSGWYVEENQSFLHNQPEVMNVTPIWGTEIYTFEYPLTYQQFKTIKANPYGYIEFYKFADDIKSGFILNMEYKMKTGMTKFELLKRYQ